MLEAAASVAVSLPSLSAEEEEQSKHATARSTRRRALLLSSLPHGAGCGCGGSCRADTPHRSSASQPGLQPPEPQYSSLPALVQGVASDDAAQQLESMRQLRMLLTTGAHGTPAPNARFTVRQDLRAARCF